MGSISRNITPLVINSLRADTHKHTCTYTDIRTETILKNQVHAGLRPACAWFKIFYSLFLKTVVSVSILFVCMQAKPCIHVHGLFHPIQCLPSWHILPLKIQSLFHCVLHLFCLPFQVTATRCVLKIVELITSALGLSICLFSLTIRLQMQLKS